MTLADCDRVSEIRVRGWQNAYRGLMPQARLDALSVREDAERRRVHFTAGPASVVNLVAEQDGEVVGWAAHGPFRDGEERTADAELYALYVDPRRLGSGIGRELPARAVGQCTAAGHPRMLLWVLKENAPARRFYRQAGFRPDGAEESFDMDGVAVPEVRYVRALTG